MTRPKNLKEIIGQSRVKQVCKILIDSAKTRKQPLPHILFGGPPGTGKTTFARAMSEEMNVRIHLSNGAVLANPRDMVKVISMLNFRDILFIDEIHRLSDTTCEFMYTVMEDFRYEIIQGKTPKSVQVAPFTLLGATTKMGTMPEPMRDRFKFTSEFEKYSIEELAQIVTKVFKEYKMVISDDVAEAISKTCRSNPRKVITRAEWVRDYLIANSIKKMDLTKLKNVLYLQGTDENGLEERDRRYLKLLEGETLSLQSLAMKLNIDPETIKNDIEPYLIEQDLIRITKQGRELCLNLA